MVPAAAAKGVPQRWQLRSPGGLATPQLGLEHRFGGPSGSVGAPSAWIRKPQSMQAMAPSSSFDPLAGRVVRRLHRLLTMRTANDLRHGTIRTPLPEPADRSTRGAARKIRLRQDNAD